MLSKNTLIRLALGEARKSEHRHRLGAVIYNKNTVISKDHNYSLRAARSLHPRFYAWPGSIHSEMACILSAKTDLAGSSMFILRINRKEELLLSKPCKYCLTYISYVGIKSVTYSVGGLDFETIKI